MDTKYELDTFALECAIADLVPATLVAWEYVESVFNGSKVPADTSAFGRNYAIDEDRMNAVLFIMSDLRGRAQRLAKIFYGPDEADTIAPT